MIQMQSMLSVADNSGAKRVMCIKILGGSKRRSAGIGDIIKVTVKEALPNSRIKKGDVYDALIVRTRSGRASPGRLVDSVRPEFGGFVECQPAANRHAYIWPGNTRVALGEIHAHCFAGAGSIVSGCARDRKTA